MTSGFRLALGWRSKKGNACHEKVLFNFPFTYTERKKYSLLTPLPVCIKMYHAGVSYRCQFWHPFPLAYSFVLEMRLKRCSLPTQHTIQYKIIAATILAMKTPINDESQRWMNQRKLRSVRQWTWPQSLGEIHTKTARLTQGLTDDDYYLFLILLRLLLTSDVNLFAEHDTRLAFCWLPKGMVYGMVAPFISVSALLLFLVSTLLQVSMWHL